MLTHGELFAGISGFGLGFQRAGITLRWAVEIDQSCQSVLRKRHPEIDIFSDVCEVGAHNLAPVDVISFGSPCQDLSVAGRRKGLNGERSGLFFEAIRVCAELRPTFAVWENVPGAFSSNSGRDFAAVLAAFRECGASDIAWRVLDAQYLGVAQRRRRVFVVADFGGERAAQVLFEPESLPGNPPPRREAGTRVTQSLTGGTGSSSCGNPDDNRAQGGFVVPVASAVVSRYGKGTDSDATDRLVTHALTAEGHDASEDVFGLELGNQGSGGNVGWHGLDKPCRTMDTNCPPGVAQGMAVRRLTPIECERLQGFPPVLEWRIDQMTRDEYCAALLAAGWVVVDCEAGEVYRTRGPGGHRFSEPQLVPGSVCNGYRVGTFKLDGGRRQIRLHRLVWIAANGIPPEGMVVAHQNNDKTDNRIANLRLITASENSTDAAEDGLYHTGLANPATKLAPELHQQICDDYRQGGITMRQLGERYGISKSRIHQIVTESGWTDGQSDSARYRQLGNAVCVNVAEWVGRRIMEVAS